ESRPEDQRAMIEKLRALTPDVLGLRDIGAVAEVVAGLDRALSKTQDADIQEAIGGVAGMLADEGIVERMVARLGEPRVPPTERAHLVNAVGALGAVSAGLVVDAYLHVAPELREAYRAAMRAAGERTVEVLQSHIENKVPEDRKSTRLNSSHDQISYAVFCLKKKKNKSAQVYHLGHI